MLPFERKWNEVAIQGFQTKKGDEVPMKAPPSPLPTKKKLAVALLMIAAACSLVHGFESRGTVFRSAAACDGSKVD